MASLILHEARHLCEQGRYIEAATQLEAALETHSKNVELAVELGETLYTLGYYDRATKVLGDTMGHFDEFSNHTVAAGSVICCVARLCSTGQFQNSLLRVEEIYDAFRASEEPETVDDATVRIEVYRCNLWLLAHTFGGVDWSHVEKASVPRLKTQFYLLMQQADFANSLKVAKSYSTFDRGPESDSLARILATDQRTPSRYRAGAEVLLAEKLDHLDRRDQQQKHYETALEAFECIKHRHGALDIKIARICQYPLDPKLENVEQTINELFNKYESLDYPSGLSSAYLKLLHLAQSLHHTELQAEILNKLERLFRASGAQLLWYTARSSTLSRLKISASDDGKVISGATALWEDLARSDCSRLRGLAAEMLFRAYSALKDQERASTWAKRARLDLPESNEAGLVSQAEGIDLGDLGSLKRFYKDTVQPVDHDTTGHTLEERIEKLEDLLNQLFKIQASHAETSDLMEQAFNRLEEAIRLLKDPTLASFKAAHFHMLQATLLTKKATPRQDVELEMEAIDQLNEAKKIHLGQGRVDQAAFVLQRQALLYFGVFRKFERWHQPDEQQVLETALNLYRVTLDSAIGLGLKFMIRDNAYWVALCQYEQWEKGKCSSGAVLDSLLSAESSADQHRNELSMLQGMQAVVTKRCLSSEKHVRDIYRFAIQVCRSTGDWGQAWMWVQKSKARSLSDLLGLGVLVPRALLDEIEEQEVTKRLYKEECTLLEQLSSAPSTERFQIRVQLDRHQKNMREHERLQELLDLREGISVTLSGLRDSSKQIAKCGDQRRMIFVDWTITQYSILMCVVLTTGEVMICTLNITLREIQEWITEHMNGEQISNVDTETKSPLQGLKEDDEVDEGPLRDLDALILPLSELSDPDDLIVLCPSGPLHSLPLHALRVVNQDGEGLPLIIRNPTVYCASLTAFVQCCRRAAAETPRETMLLNSLLAVYEPEPDVDGSATGDFDLDERRNVYSSVESLATNLHAEAYCGERATSTVLKKSLEETHVVYFLGHCDSNGKTITNQSLRLFNDTDVTVQDLFSLRVRASHVSLLACGSLHQHFEAGDEPLGLATALLSAGAASVLGNLWPVESRTARAFSELFYAHLAQARRDGNGPGFYDLACAVREAVADVRQGWERRQPFHWASFVLHGAWFLGGSLRD